MARKTRTGKRKDDPAPAPPQDRSPDPERVLDDDQAEDAVAPEQDDEDMPSGSVQDQLLYQQGLEENRIDDSVSASLDRAERARSRISKRTVPPVPRARRGRAAAKRPGSGKKR
jgi:hypothetical protein